MLSPRYLEGLSDDIIEIYSQLESEILQDMARRIARLGKITEATRWQAQMLAEAGGLKKNIARILAKYDKAIIKQVTEIFTEALKTNARNDNRIFKAMTGRTVSAPNAQAMLSTIQKCHSDLSRLTLTTAKTTQQQFVQQANRVYINVQSGAFDYNTAMKDAADELSKQGIKIVKYENGRPVKRTIESAVRMNILTGINQTAANQTLNNAEELGVEKFEVTAHIGARPDHAAWQGKIYTRKQLYSICELGTATGLCGINCRHSFYPYFDGMEKHYTDKDLDELASEKVKYNGEELTRYDGEQKLRGIERKIRAYKRQALTQEAAGADSTKARRKLGECQAAARDFTKQTGIARDRAREYIGTATGKQPKGIPPKVQHTVTQQKPKTPNEMSSANKEIVKVEETRNFKELTKLLDERYKMSVSDDVKELSFENIKNAMQGVESVIKDFPDVKITNVEISKHGAASFGKGEITFNPGYFKSAEKLKKVCDYNSAIKRYTPNSSAASLGAHECGHAVEEMLIRLNPRYEFDFQRILAYNDCTEASAIVKQAVKNIQKTAYGKKKRGHELIKSISKYATDNDSETLAEAFADVYTNGKQANPLSIEIKKITLEVYKRYKGGK